MQIREATHNDIPQILKVLKASLGETSSKKTEEVWRYKHIDNPFGESLVLVAEMNKEIVGVRAFMRWQWQKGGKIFSAFRAVDTATHPSHQGKGIFKKLTLRALEIGKERGDHFVFNTPNSQSKPGYLNMGWKEVDRLVIYIYPNNPFTLKKRKRAPINEGLTLQAKAIRNLTQEHNYIESNRNVFFTPKSWEYLFWRFEDNPLQKYQIFADGDFFLAFYIKKHKRFKELRIAEHIFYNSKGQKKIQQFIDVYARLLKVLIVASSKEIDLSWMKLRGNFGPMLTIREINTVEDFSGILDLGNWSYSIGDLELF